MQIDLVNARIGTNSFQFRQRTACPGERAVPIGRCVLRCFKTADKPRSRASDWLL